jgi:hypothetical protein
VAFYGAVVPPIDEADDVVVRETPEVEPLPEPEQWTAWSGREALR